MTDELLAAVDLPAGALSTGGGITWGLALFDVPPGARSVWPAASGACCPGPRIAHVLTGNYAVRADGPVQVRRAGGGTPEEAPAGTEVVLGPGDAMVSRNETAFAATNPWATPVEHLVEVFARCELPIPPAPPDWVLWGSDAASELDGLARARSNW